jgi:phage nucleotide-binding protein
MEIKKLIDTVTGHGNFILYGPSGSGKTFSISTIPGKVLILSAEKGLRTLAEIMPNADVVEVNTIEDMREAHGVLSKGGEYDVVVIDSLSEIGEMALAEAKAATKDGRQAYMGMADTIGGLIKAYNELPCTVIFIGQEERVAAELIGQVDYLYAPAVPGKAFASRVPFKLDFVFCLRTKVDDEGTMKRAFQTGPNGDYLAKSRSQRLELMEAPNWEHIFNKLGQGVS